MLTCWGVDMCWWPRKEEEVLDTNESVANESPKGSFETAGDTPKGACPNASRF